MDDKKIHVTSIIKGHSKYINASNAWLIKDSSIDGLADKLIDLLNIPDIMASVQREIDSRHNKIHKEGFENYKELDKAIDEYRSLIVARRILFEEIK